MIETRAVALASTSQLLPKLGRAWRTLAGRVIRKKTWTGVMPKAWPASSSPRGTARMPPRNVSVMYAPKMNPMENVPAANSLIST